MATDAATVIWKSGPISSAVVFSMEVRAVPEKTQQQRQLYRRKEVTVIPNVPLRIALDRHNAINEMASTFA
jgi:hypothetical protein